MHDDALPSGKADPGIESTAPADGGAGTSALTAPTEPGYPALTFDADEFIQYVKDHDLSEEEACEFLAVVWVYVVAWVDMGFGIHPVQQAQKAREAKAREGTVRKGNAKLDHESALVVSCREAFNKDNKDKIVARPNGRGAGKKDS